MSVYIQQKSSSEEVNTLFPHIPSSLSDLERDRGVAPQSGTQNGVHYKILSGKEMKKVQERIRMLGKLHTMAEEPSQKQFIKLQYKAEVSKELESNLARVRHQKQKLETELKSEKRKLKDREEGVEKKGKEINGLKRKLRETEQSLETKSGEVDEMRKAYGIQKDLNKHLIAKLADSGSRIAKMESEFEKTAERRVKRARETVIADMEEQKKQASFVHEQQLKKKDVEMKDLRQRVEKRERELKDTRSELETAYKKQRTTEEKINTFIGEFQLK